MARSQDSGSNEFLQLTRTLNGIGVAAIGAIVGGAYYFVYLPMTEADRSSGARTAAVEEFLLQESEIRTSHAAAQSRLRDHVTRLGELLKRIPKSPEEASFLAQLSELSNDVGVRIRQFDPGDTKVVGNYASLEIDVVAEASYASLCQLLEGLAQLPRLSEVTALSIEDADPTADVYPITLTLRIYFARLGDEDDPAEANRA
jgi:Tfp pilus assembly protein PilO